MAISILGPDGALLPYDGPGGGGSGGGGLTKQETADAQGLAPASVASGSPVDKLSDIEAAVTNGTISTGTAGSPAVDVVSMQGVAGGTAVPVSLATLPALATGANAIGKLAANAGVNIGTVTLSAIPALVAGTAAIGKLAANSGVDIGDVDVTSLPGSKYETVAASQTAQVMGSTGATGNLINGILVIPATTSPGNVLLLDNATSITVFAGGATSVSNLVPFFIPLGIKSVSGAWKITTGANVSCIAVGDFT